MKHTPATPLPWDRVVGLGQHDGEYAAHAANAYPKLVDAIKKIKYTGAGSPHIDRAHAEMVYALLRELGEDA